MQGIVGQINCDSGGEPTIEKRHLIALLEELKLEGCLKFILEANGILVASDEEYARQLSNYPFLHVRISFKGCSEDEFELPTGARPEAFTLQIEALNRLMKARVSCHPAVMASFSTRDAFKRFQKRIGEIDTEMRRNMEVEEVILYPQVVKRIRRYVPVHHVSHLSGKVSQSTDLAACAIKQFLS